MLEALQVCAVTFPPTVPYIPPAATHQNTVALSPGSSSQPAPQNSRHREIFLPSLIVGGLIGGCIIIGLTQARPPQPVEQSSASPESSPNRDQVQNLPTPAQSPVSITPESPTVKEPQEQKVSPVPQFTTPFAQPPSSTRPQIDRPPAEQAVRNYYYAINKRDFRSAWNQLSLNYQNNKTANPDGYNSYIDFWVKRQDQSINVEQVNSVKVTAQEVIVNVNIISVMMITEQVSHLTVSILLSWDARNSRWIIDDFQYE